MRTFIIIGLLASASMARGQDANAVVDRAIRAHGGAEALAKLKHMTYVAKGRVNVNGVDYDAKRKTKAELPERWLDTCDLPPLNLQIMTLLVGRDGWQRINKQPTKELNALHLPEVNDEAYLHWLMQLVTVKQTGFSLSAAPDATVDAAPAAVVKVTRTGKPDALLHFSKTNQLLVKITLQHRDPGLLSERESIYGNHKSFGGVQMPTSLTDLKALNRQPPQRLGIWEITEYKFPDKFDADTFKKP